MRNRNIVTLIVATALLATGITLLTRPTTRVTTTLQHVAATVPIIAGPSRSECLEPTDNIAGGDRNAAILEAANSAFEALTNSTVSCTIIYGSDLAWSDWVNPWFGSTYYGFDLWVAQDPTRRVVAAISLVPNSIGTPSDPLPWEQACDAGTYNNHAIALARNLVADGLGNSIIRLGWEMNGTWMQDSMGTTAQEENDWARCYVNEVKSMRRVKGEKFLFDWNPNACTGTEPYRNYYPGNAYVDILGLDFYDISCDTPNTAISFAQLAALPQDLDHFIAFAKLHGLPMSFPEWGLLSAPAGDDPQYLDGVASTVANYDFAFEAYFDVVNGGTLPLSAGATPLSVVQFQHWFGNV